MSVPQLSGQMQLPNWHQAEKRKNNAQLTGSYVFKPIAIESLSSLSTSALNLFLDLRHDWEYILGFGGLGVSALSFWRD